MTLVKRGDVIMGCQNEIQLAAFLRAGWEIYTPPTKTSVPQKKAEEWEANYATKTGRGRKKG